MSASAAMVPAPRVHSAAAPQAAPRRAAAHRFLQRLARHLPAVEIIFGIAVTLASVYLHVAQARIAGALWRDETVSVQIATLPTFGEMWRYLEFDSYPALYHLVLRSWCALFTSGDDSLRVLGLMIGLSLPAVFWLAGRTLGVRAPLLALALLTLNPVAIRYGDSARAYGLGCTLAVVSLAAVWGVARAERLDRRRLLWAMAAAVLSVQCLYHNATLLLAGCLAGATIALWNRRPKIAAWTMSIGVPAALSLLPYLPIIRRTRRWSFLMYYPLTPKWLWSRLTMVTGSPDPLGPWVWSGLFGLMVGLAGWYVWRSIRRGGQPGLIKDCRMFAALGLLAATVVYAGFLFLVGYITQPWYYLAFLAFAGMSFDAFFGQVAASTGARLFRLLVALSFSLIVYDQSVVSLNTRNTNLDLVAATLDHNVRADDLVLVNRWECAISLNRYYRGPARVMTIPPLADHVAHRYDLLVDLMMTDDPLRPVFDAMHTTLQHGGRVFLVGRWFLPYAGESVSPHPPARIDANGKWHWGETVEHWALQVNDDLFRHFEHGTLVPIRSKTLISEYEDVPLAWFVGWKEDHLPAPVPAVPSATPGVP